MNNHSTNTQIPIYSLQAFVKNKPLTKLYQVETFDANRHFQVAYPHRHDFYEILFLTKGSGFHIIDSNQYEIKPPCVFFMSPGQAHKLNLSHDIEGYIYIFTSEFYSLFNTNSNKLLEFPFFFSISQNNPPLYIHQQSDAVFFSELFERSSSECLSEKPDNEFNHAVLELILVTCNKLYQNTITHTKVSKSDILVKKFLQLLEENYISNYSIDFYAKQLAITPNHLTQIVKHITGKTTITLLQEKRIIEIKRLLLHTNMSISEIAEFLHIPDVSYITKFFKKFTKTTPLEYRKNISKQ